MPDTSISRVIASPVESEREEECVNGPTSFGRSLRRWLWHIVGRQFTLLCVIALAIARWIGRKPRATNGQGREIMVTGRFESDNWILAHLLPLSASKECSRLWMVSTNPVPALPKVVGIYPPKWLMKVVGVTQARLLTFLWAAMRKRPHVVGGFHFIVNGISSAIVGRLAGARSMYFCVGGPAEVCDGGVHNEGGILTKMETTDMLVEKRLMKVASDCDAIVTMGSRAADFFVGKGIKTGVHVVSGGIDSRRFYPAKEAPSIDLILTGRLVPIKRIDIFLKAVKYVSEEFPEVRSAVVGDGRWREELQKISIDLGVDHNVDFVGHQDTVADWLRKSKMIVLTSDSEGLPLSVMEAMMCGLPAVVSDVGDLGDLVQDGVNGYLVPRRSPELFADRLVELLSDARKLESFSQAARRSALRYETEETVQRWDRILANF